MGSSPREAHCHLCISTLPLPTATVTPDTHQSHKGTNRAALEPVKLCQTPDRLSHPPRRALLPTRQTPTSLSQHTHTHTPHSRVRTWQQWAGRRVFSASQDRVLLVHQPPPHPHPRKGSPILPRDPRTSLACAPTPSLVHSMPPLKSTTMSHKLHAATSSARSPLNLHHLERLQAINTRRLQQHKQQEEEHPRLSSSLPSNPPNLRTTQPRPASCRPREFYKVVERSSSSKTTNTSPGIRQRLTPFPWRVDHPSTALTVTRVRTMRDRQVPSTRIATNMRTIPEVGAKDVSRPNIQGDSHRSLYRDSKPDSPSARQPGITQGLSLHRLGSNSIDGGSLAGEHDPTQAQSTASMPPVQP